MHVWGWWSIWRISVPFCQFWCEPKTALKKKKKHSLEEQQQQTLGIFSVQWEVRENPEFHPNTTECQLPKAFETTGTIFEACASNNGSVGKNKKDEGAL